MTSNAVRKPEKHEALYDWILRACSEPVYLQRHKHLFSEQSISVIVSELQNLMVRETPETISAFFQSVKTDIERKVQLQNESFEDPEDDFAKVGTPNNTD